MKVEVSKKKLTFIPTKEKGVVTFAPVKGKEK